MNNKQYVVEWSSKERKFHILDVKSMMQVNYFACLEGREHSFFPVAFVNSLDRAQGVVREMEKVRNESRPNND